MVKPRGCSQRKLRTDSCYKDIQSKQAWTSPQNWHPQINRRIYILYWPFYFHRVGSLREDTRFLTQSVSTVNQVRSGNFYFTEVKEKPKAAQNAQKWDIRKSTVSKKVREEGIFRKKAAAKLHWWINPETSWGVLWAQKDDLTLHFPLFHSVNAAAWHIRYNPVTRRMARGTETFRDVLSAQKTLMCNLPVLSSSLNVF